MPQSRSFHGQSIAEYSIAGALVALLCLPAVYLVSKSFSSHISTVKALLYSPKQETGSALMAATYTGIEPNTSSVAGYSTNNGAAGIATLNLSFTTSNGNHIQLDNLLPASISRTVESSGTNGATQMLASTMTQLSAQLLAAGEISPQQHKALNKLANQGHEIAKIEALIETAASRNYQGTPKEQVQAFLSQKVQYQGKLVTIQELNRQIGYRQQTQLGQQTNSEASFSIGVLPSDPLNPDSTPYPATREFLKLYDNLKKTGALSNPQVKEIVTSLSIQIAMLGETANQATSEAIRGPGSSQGINSLEARLMSHTQSLGLCGKSGVNDNGIHCGA